MVRAAVTIHGKVWIAVSRSVPATAMAVVTVLPVACANAWMALLELLVINAFASTTATDMGSVMRIRNVRALMDGLAISATRSNAQPATRIPLRTKKARRAVEMVSAATVRASADRVGQVQHVQTALAL